MQVVIESFDNVGSFDQKIIIQQVFDIFIDSSNRKTFEGMDDKRKFFECWVAPYIEKLSKHLWLALDEKQNILGYLTGCPDTIEAMKFLKYPGINLFNDFFKTYPAHLHINCRSDARGLGIGGKLLNTFFNQLITLNIKGGHIVTSSTAPNIYFYQKMGMVITSERELMGERVVLMAKSFNTP